MCFRMFVILLLLKMLFAMIFEGYKKVTRSKSKKGNSVLKDIYEIMWHQFNTSSAFLLGTCYVSPVELEVALRDDTLTEEKLGAFALIKQLRKVFPDKGF